MDEREEHFKSVLIKAFPLLDSFQKGYMLGLVEGRVLEREQEERKSREKQLPKT